jgi:hypothetical protein
MSKSPSEWKRTGEVRIVPWWFGIMRAEFEERRSFAGYSGTFDDGTFQLRWVGTGRLPAIYDNSGPFGYWSTLSTPRDMHYGMRAVWRQLIQHFNKIPETAASTDFVPPTNRKQEDI